MKRDLGLPQGVVGWIYNHASREFWRVAAIYEFDDLVQDGLMIAFKCRERYGTPGVDIDPPHFHQLVQTSFRNHITDIVRREFNVQDSTKFADLNPALSETDNMDRVTEAQEPDVDFALMIAELPEHLRKAVRLLLSSDGVERLRQLRVRLNGDDSLSAKLSRLIGFPVNTDFERELRTFLWESRFFENRPVKTKYRLPVMDRNQYRLYRKLRYENDWSRDDALAEVLG